MPGQFCLVFLLCTLTAQPTEAADEKDIVQLLRDAQATNRDSWKIGQAKFLLEMTREESPAVALIEGEVSWNESDMILRYKVSDPEGIRFTDRGKSLEKEWNFISQNSKDVITYAAKHDVLNQRKSSPNAFEPIYNMSILTVFTMCGPPSGVNGLSWQQMIGPSDGGPEQFRSSKFTHDILANGDIEQTRVDESGNKLIIAFSSKENFAVKTTKQYNPDGSAGQELEYRYTRHSDGTLVPSSAVAAFRSPRTKKLMTFRYTYSNVRLPGDVTPVDFRTESILARIRRETDAGQRKPVMGNPVVNDSALDALSRSLRESGSARPLPH